MHQANMKPAAVGQCTRGSALGVVRAARRNEPAQAGGAGRHHTLGSAGSGGMHDRDSFGCCGGFQAASHPSGQVSSTLNTTAG